MPTVIILSALFFGSLMSKSHRDDPDDTHINQSISDFYIGLLPQSVQDFIFRFAGRILILLSITLVVLSIHSCMFIHSEGNRIRHVADSLRACIVRKPTKLDTSLALKPLTVWDIVRPSPIAQDDVSFTSPYRLNIRQDLP